MTKTSQNRALLLNLGAITVLTAVSSIVFKLSLAYRDPISSDFTIYIEIAKGLSLNPATYDPKGVWPLGYPLALRALSFLGNWHYAGAAISFINGICKTKFTLLSLKKPCWYALKRIVLLTPRYFAARDNV